MLCACVATGRAPTDQLNVFISLIVAFPPKDPRGDPACQPFQARDGIRTMMMVISYDNVADNVNINKACMKILMMIPAILIVMMTMTTTMMPNLFSRGANLVGGEGQLNLSSDTCTRHFWKALPRCSRKRTFLLLNRVNLTRLPAEAFLFSRSTPNGYIWLWCC